MPAASSPEGSATPAVAPPTTIAGELSIAITDRGHTTDPITYKEVPPMGGPHWSAWQNCGVYDQPIQNEQGGPLPGTRRGLDHLPAEFARRSGRRCCAASSTRATTGCSAPTPTCRTQLWSRPGASSCRWTKPTTPGCCNSCRSTSKTRRAGTRRVVQRQHRHASTVGRPTTGRLATGPTGIDTVRAGCSPACCLFLTAVLPGVSPTPPPAPPQTPP